MKAISSFFNTGIFSILIFSNLYAQVPTKPVLWLDAAKGVVKNNNNQVSNWTDVTSQFMASQIVDGNKPTYIPLSIGNLPSIRFNGSSHYMDAPSVFPVKKDYTIIAVSQAFATCQNIVGGTSRTLWMAGTTTPQILHNGDFNNQVRSSLDPKLSPSIIVAQYRNQTQQGMFYINSQFADSSYCPMNVDSTIYISAYQKCCFFNGDIAEILIYDRIISSTERITLENYLFNKYKINRPSPPPALDSSFANFPKNYELIPRDVNNKAEIKISGNIILTSFDSIKCVVLKNNLPYLSRTNSLIFKNNKAAFSFNPTIDAGLQEYRVEVSLIKQQKDSIIRIVDHLVCGDVYIITGQSNSIFGGTAEINNYCRTFGRNYSSNKQDTNWVIASAAGNGGGPDIGAWGMFMAKKIIETYQLPICVMNGGVGGTSIQQHQRNDINPYEPNNIYGSLNYRMLKSRLANAAKGIFWYQGESNNSNQYFENFKSLYQDWLVDFPNVQKVYVIQIHHGCGSGDHNRVREIQRALPQSFPMISVMSTMALPGHDGCHYVVNGYKELGNRMYNLVAKDFYQATTQNEILAPNIKKAFYTSKTYDALALIFYPETQGLKIQRDSMIGRYKVAVKDYLYLDNLSRKIKSITTNKDTLFAILNEPYLAKTISYLPEVHYLDTALVYQGPYITNQNGIGALTFYNFNIDSAVITYTDDKLAKQSMYTYPNPMSTTQFNELNFYCNHNLDKAIVEFYSLDGRLQCRSALIALESNIYGLSNSLNISDIQQGILIFKIIDPKLLLTGKLFITQN